MKNVYIIAAKRTPIGSFLGSLSNWHPADLTAHALQAAIQQSNMQPSELQMLIHGQVIQAGYGQHVAKQVAIKSGLPKTTITFSVNKVCASSMKALHLAYLYLQAGLVDVVAVTGAESMSTIPFVLKKYRQGNKLGDSLLQDLLLYDGLTDAHLQQHMGLLAERLADEMQISREEQDAYAQASYEKAQAAIAAGYFEAEITPIPEVLAQDEEPFKVKFDKIRSIKPAFKDNGTITAANASTLNDGAVALILVGADYLKRHTHIKPLAEVLSIGDIEHEPMYFTTTPAGAIKNALKKESVTLKEIDLFEINEAFSVVSIANMRLLEIDPTSVNRWGGAVALGHPLGASGARIVTSLLYQLRHYNMQIGAAAICNGGGGGSAAVIKKST